MSRVQPKEVRYFNGIQKKKAHIDYELVLFDALRRYEELSGDKRPLGLLRGKQYSKLYDFADSCSEQQYQSATLHFVANQVAALIKKYPWPPDLLDLGPEQRAVEKFLKAEHSCKRTNQWFRASRRSFSPYRYYLERMTNFIRYVLSDTVRYDLIFDACNLSAGASIGVHGNVTNLGRKLSVEKWSATPSSLPYLRAALNRNHHFSVKSMEERNGIVCLQADYCFEEVVYNKIAFVPKTAKIFRPIAVEPLGNGYLQKGVDLFMRYRLKRIGIDLADQDLNRRMAREGSEDGPESFCTIDLSSASDSISIELVREILPTDWFVFLNSIRSPSYKYQGNVVRYEKFCSMGNGFCFPLETLIFAAVCHSVGCGQAGVDYMVYGDDIIVRKPFASKVLDVLKRIGFKPNVSKTFLGGPFRESCGSDWYSGEDVRPFTLDFRLDSLEAIFKFCNLARRNTRCTEFFRESILRLISEVPDRLQFWRPYKGPPNTALDPLDVILPKAKLSWSYDRDLQCHRWYELFFDSVEDRRRYPSWIVMAAALSGSPSVKTFTVRRKTVMRVRSVARSGHSLI